MELKPREVQQALKTLGWSTVEAAFRLGVTEDTITNYLSGKSKCRGAAAVLLTRFVKEEKERGNDNQEGE